jgi:hypothetical protein
MGEEFGEEGELGEAAHCEEALEDEGTTGMGGGGEYLPNGIHLLALLERQGIQRRLQHEVGPLVGHALVADTEFARVVNLFMIIRDHALVVCSGESWQRESVTESGHRGH